MVQNGQPTSVHWNYPLFIIGHPDGSLVAVPYEGFDCCLLYVTKELAELYLSQAAELGYADRCAHELKSPDALRSALEALKSANVAHAIWDSPIQPSGCKLTSIDDVLREIAARGSP